MKLLTGITKAQLIDLKVLSNKIKEQGSQKRPLEISDDDWSPSDQSPRSVQKIYTSKNGSPKKHAGITPNPEGIKNTARKGHFRNVTAQ